MFFLACLRRPWPSLAERSPAGPRGFSLGWADTPADGAGPPRAHSRDTRAQSAVHACLPARPGQPALPRNPRCTGRALKSFKTGIPDCVVWCSRKNAYSKVNKQRWVNRMSEMLVTVATFYGSEQHTQRRADADYGAQDICQATALAVLHVALARAEGWVLT